MSIDPTAPATQRADARRNRARLLQAAREQLATGEGSLAANALAKQAGVGVGTVYRHFPDRRSLIEGLAAEGMERLVRAARAGAADADPAHGLRETMREWLRIMDESPGLAELLEGPEPACAETVGLGEELAAANADLLARAHQAGAIAPELGTDDLRRLLCGIHTAVRGGDPDLVERYLDLVVKGLRA